MAANEPDLYALTRLPLGTALDEVRRLGLACDPAVRWFLLHQDGGARIAAACALAGFGRERVLDLLVGMAPLLQQAPRLFWEFECALLDGRFERLGRLLPWRDADPAVAVALVEVRANCRTPWGSSLNWGGYWPGGFGLGRRGVARLLARLGISTTPLGWSLLLDRLLTDPRPAVRREALRSLSIPSLPPDDEAGRLKPILLAVLDPHPDVRAAALDRLRWTPFPKSAQLRGKIAQAVYDRLADDPVPAVRRAAAAWVGHHEPDAEPLLAGHHDPEVRYAWFRVAQPSPERVADPDVLRLLARMLDDTADPDGQEHAARCLLHQDDARLLPLLLSHPSEAVRAAVAVEMADAPWRAWWAPLAVGLLHDPNPAVRALLYRLKPAGAEGFVFAPEETLRRERETAAWESAPPAFASDGSPTPDALLRARLWPGGLESEASLRGLVRTAARADDVTWAGALRLLEVLSLSPRLPALLREEDVDGRVALALDIEPFPREADAPAEPLGVERDGVAAVERYWRESFASPLASRKLRAIEHVEALLTQRRHPPLRRAMLEGTDDDRRRVLGELV